MKSVAHIFGSFSNDGKLLGAYGPRTFGQLPHVLQRICDDVETRQAVATIWNALELLDHDNKDMPCTVALTWTLRDGKLNMQTFMRSNDVFLGVTYDYPMFTRLQISLAWALGVGVGEYVHTAVNLHLYERDLQKTEGLHRPEDAELPADLPFAPVERDWSPQGTPLPWNQVQSRWSRVQEWMTCAVLGLALPVDAPDNAIWYAERLKRHVSAGTFHSRSRYVLQDTVSDA
jgi:hypothetical protein